MAQPGAYADVATKREMVPIRLTNGTWTEMELCGRAPPINGRAVIVAWNGVGCFAAGLTPDGWVVIADPVQLYPIAESKETGR